MHADPHMITDTAPIQTPIGPGEVTPQWFTALFHNLGLVDAGTSVTDLSSTPIGNGLVCESIRFSLTFDGPAGQAPASVVCKFPSADPAYRAAGVSEMVYSREISFYTDLKDAVAIRAPRPVHVADDAETGNFVLVLEDLGPAVTGDQIAGCSVAQAESLMDAASALHGPTWGREDLDDAEWNVRPHWIPRIQETYPAVFAEFKKVFADRNTEQELAIGDEFGPVIARWFDAQPRPWTVTHGDFRLDNLLFEILGGAEPVAVLDWQTIMPGPGAADVSYFLGGCLPIELRRANEDALLARYHDGLVQRGVGDYPLSRLVDDYRYNAFMGYFMCTYAAPLVPRTERGDQMFSVWLQRTAAQILDHDSLSLLPRP